MTGERNLAPERGPNVWEQEGWSPESGSQNRWLQGLGGAAIAVTGAALAAVGGTMIYKATRGRAGAAVTPAIPPEARLSSGAVPEQANRLEDVVARESAQSFPASDAPSWTPTMGVNPNEKKGPNWQE